MKSTLEYPLNALEEAINYFEGEPIAYSFPNGINDEQIRGVLYVIDNLQLSDRDIIISRYKNSESVQDIAKSRRVTSARIYQYLHNAFKDILTSPFRHYIWDGVDSSLDSNKLLKLTEIGLSRRIINALNRANIHNVNDVFDYVEKYGIAQFKKIRCFGEVSYTELQQALDKVGLTLEDNYDREK